MRPHLRGASARAVRLGLGFRVTPLVVTTSPCAHRSRDSSRTASASVILCSYLWRGGRLVPVPATRADIFATDGLTLPQRRGLTRFLTAAQAAMQGEGPLQVAPATKP